MIFWLHHPIPVPCHAVVIVLRTIQLVVGERQLILRSSDRIRVCLIPKVDVRYVEVVRHSISFVVFTKKCTRREIHNMEPASIHWLYGEGGVIVMILVFNLSIIIVPISITTVC